ncbi:MAG TPA: hypothetical protein VGD37_09340 [Kofleriaceae bacterium]|jgi:hypothetical protein
MKKTRDKKFGLSRETVRELTTPDGKASPELARVVGGSCTSGATTHCSNYCIDNDI